LRREHVRENPFVLLPVLAAAPEPLKSLAMVPVINPLENVEFVGRVVYGDLSSGESGEHFNYLLEGWLRRHASLSEVNRWG
jgi:hypothetical protein